MIDPNTEHTYDIILSIFIGIIIAFIINMLYDNQRSITVTNSSDKIE